MGSKEWAMGKSKMSYPAYEETKTMDLRWLRSWRQGGHGPILQQRWLIRDGIGEQAKHSEEWRDVGFAVMGKRNPLE